VVRVSNAVSRVTLRPMPCGHMYLLTGYTTVLAAVLHTPLDSGFQSGLVSSVHREGKVLVLPMVVVN
jgi:hypothetical protein